MSDNHKRLPIPPLPGKGVTPERVSGAAQPESSLEEPQSNTLPELDTPIKPAEQREPVKKQTSNMYGLPVRKKPTTRSASSRIKKPEPINSTSYKKELRTDETVASYSYKNQPPPSGEPVEPSTQPDPATISLPDRYAESITGYESEYSKSENREVRRSKPRTGKLALILTLSFIFMSVLFSWMNPAGLDWFFGLAALPVGISLAMGSFFRKEKPGLAVTALILALLAPLTPATMFLVGFFSTLAS